MNNVSELVGLVGKGNGAKFASITYRAKGTGELAKYHVILGADTRKLYEKDVVALMEMIPTLSGMNLIAANEILASRNQSLTKGIGNNDAYTNADTYVHADGIPGVKIHKETGVVYVTCLVENKTVIEKGEYKTVNSSLKTLAKKAISSTLPSSRFRQMILKKVTRAAMNGEVLEIVAE